MSTVPLHRKFAALFAVSSVLCVQACYAYQRPLAGSALADARVRVQSAAPFVVRPAVADDTVGGAADCRATLIEGFATSASADAVTFQNLTRVVPDTSHGASCRWAKNAPAIIPTDGADVTVNRLSGKRTTVFLIVAAVTAFAVVAYAASQFTFSPTGGGDCAFC
jgi:hypothetical protein